MLEIAPALGLALSTDGVGSKVIVAEQARRYDTVGIDCVAMNVNDLICVGRRADRDARLPGRRAGRRARCCAEHRRGPASAGAEQAGIEIPGGELAQLPELIRGHPSPRGFDLVGRGLRHGRARRASSPGAAIEPGDALIGLPSSGVHSNGYTLARRALLEHGGLALDDRPPELGGASVGDALLEPTVIYVRAVLELLRSDVPVRGLAHITGDGLLEPPAPGGAGRLRDRRAAAGPRRSSA